MRPRNSARVLGLTAAALLTVGLAAAPQLAAAAPQPSKFTLKSVPTGTAIQGAKSQTGQIAKSNPDLVKSTSRAYANVMVKLDVDPAASYRGGVRGYAATSPSVTGAKFAKSSAATRSYVAHVNAYAANAAARIRSAVPAAEVLRAYAVAYGGLLVRLPANQAKNLLKVKGVVAVQQDARNHPLADPADDQSSIPNDTTHFVGANKVWPDLGGQAKAGEGVIVGVLDTGIWPEHPMLRDTGMPAPKGGPWACQFGDGTDAALGPAFHCNNKLIGAYAFLDTNLAVNGGSEDGEYCDDATGECSARDSEGHGTHTTTTAAGDRVAHADLLGVDRGPISGIAPGASVIMYRVCLATGCYNSDSVAAVQQAIEDGVDVLNFSIGGGANAYSDPVELSFLDAYAAGINVNASAGNDGPGTATAEHAGPWVTTVGALTSDRAFQSRLVLTADDGSHFSKVGATVTQGVTDKHVVLASRVPHYRDALCQTPLPANSVRNKVVACQRGVNARVDKGFNVLQGGAAGMILYNTVRSDVETDNHWLPAIHLDGPNNAFLNFLTTHTGVTATWAAGQKARVRGDVMAGFSSRGPDGDFLKPDVAAPGVQVLAGNTPTPTGTDTGPGGQYYQAIAGTSMSSPHAAGISALVRAEHPDWTPGQVKSALMTSSVQDVINPDGSAATPWDRGAGSLRADRAVSPTVTFGVSPAAYYASAADPLHRVDLNVPSINADPLAGALSTHRIVRNVSGQSQTFDVTGSAAGDLQISISPSTFTLGPDETMRMRITLDGTAASTGWHFGQIVVRARNAAAHDAVLPVAANVQQGSLAVSQNCDPTSVLRNHLSTCSVNVQNNAPVAADATVRVTADPDVQVSNVSSPAHALSDGAKWTGTLTPSLPADIDSITPGGSQGGGYLPLSNFGIAPVPGFGDETIMNFSVPSYQYGGESYDSLGVDSNGYVVIGGGTSTDNECCTIPSIPSTVRPNNFIAPLWTDLSLDPASGGGNIRVGSLTDGVNDYLVVDYDHVKTFGTGGSGVENSFEVWITLGSTEDVSFAYGTIGGAAGQPAAYGAENKDGTSGVAIAAPSSDTDFTVNAGNPTPGGAVHFTYQATSAKPGAYRLLTSVRSPLVRGTTTASTTLTVNK
jgi:subtilisin family serine protease